MLCQEIPTSHLKKYKKVWKWIIIQWKYQLLQLIYTECELSVVNKSRKEIYKVDNEQVNPFKIIAFFPSIKSKIDLSCTQQGLDTGAIDEMVGKYQLDGDGAYYFTRDSRFTFFNLHFRLSIGLMQQQITPVIITFCIY